MTPLNDGDTYRAGNNAALEALRRAARNLEEAHRVLLEADQRGPATNAVDKALAETEEAMRWAQ